MKKINQTQVNKKKRNVFETIISIILTITFIFEIFLQQGIIPVFTYVDNDYNHSIFAAIITLSTLSFTILSIIISLESNKINGIKLKEIIKFKSFPYDISEMIIVYLSLDLISIMALTYNWVMLITTILIIDVLVTAYYAGFLFHFISDDKRLKDIIEEEAQSNPQLFKDKYINDWIIELKKSITERNEILCNEYAALLKEIIIDKDCNTQIQANLPEIFRLSCDSFGFTESIKLIIDINEKKSEDFDCEEIIYDYFETLKLKDEKIIQNLKISGTINDIVEHKHLNDNVKINTLYWLFDSIFNNSIIKEDYKYILLTNYLNSLHRLYDKDNEGEIRLTTSLYILKHAVLLNTDYDSAQEVFKIITKSLAYNNTYSDEKCYVKLLAYVLRAFYFYIYFDNSLSRNQKKNLKEIFQSKEQTVEGIEISFNKLIYNHSGELLKHLLDSPICDKEYHDIMDHFSRLSGMRAVVWSNKNKLLFAFCYYVAFGYDYTIFPLVDRLKCEPLEQSKIDLLIEMLNFYDFQSEKLEETILSNIDDLIKLIDITDKYDDSLIKESFNQINNKLKAIYNTSQIGSDNFTNEKIYKKSYDLISKKIKGVEIDNNTNFNNTKEFYLIPEIIKDDDYFINTVSNKICYAVIEAMNKQMKDSLLPLKLSFNKDGILKLLSEFNRKKYNYGNYKFIDDLAFNNDIQTTSEYKELDDLIKEIKIVNTREINCRFFIKQSDLIISYSIEKITFEDLSDENINDFIRNYKISSSLYKINNVVYSKSEISEFVKSHYKVLNATIKFGININKYDGVRITH